MPKEAAPLGRSQSRSGHQQQVYGQSHQQPSSYHHLQQYHHLPRPPGYEYYSTTAAYQNEAQQGAQAPSAAIREVPSAYEHALKMTAKYDRLPYAAAPQGAGAFKMAVPYELHPACTQAPLTSVQHKTSYESFPRTTHSTMVGYNRGSQPMASVQYDHKITAYPPALPYDRFSKKKLATHAPEKSPSVGGPYGTLRNDKKPQTSVYDRPVIPSTSYERLTSKVSVSSPMDVDKGAQNLTYERHKAYRVSEYERRERHRRVAECAERAEVQYERQYEVPVSSAYERLGAAPPPIPTMASSYERQAPPTQSYERHTNVSAAYERRAVFDRAYEAAAYERRLFPSTSAFSSLNHVYYTSTANVSGRASSPIMHAANPVHASSTTMHVASPVHASSPIMHGWNPVHTSTLIMHAANPVHASSTIMHGGIPVHASSTIMHVASPVHALSPIMHGANPVHASSPNMFGASPDHDTSPVMHVPCKVSHALNSVERVVRPNVHYPNPVARFASQLAFTPNPVIKFLSPPSPQGSPCRPDCMCFSPAWHYPYPSYGSSCIALSQAALYSRGQERQVLPDEFEAKDVTTSSIYPAKPRMSLLTSPEYLCSLSRRSQQVEDNSRSGQPSVIVPPSRSPADGSASRKRLREGGRPEPLPPLTIDTSMCSPRPDPEKPSIYMPTVEPISPTSPPDAAGDDCADAGICTAPKSSAKDSLLLDIARVDREINKSEHHIFNLKRKQVELEQKAMKSSVTEPSDETVEAPLPQHFSLSHKIYSENRRRAKEAHAALSHLGPPVDLPLYNQPSDTSVYQENRRKHLLFKGRLIAHLRRRRREKRSSEIKMAEDYARRTETWNRLVEKMERSPERKRRDAENRELFEKTFPKIRKEREDRERFLRVGSRVKSDADLEEIMDNLHEQEMEVKKMRDYAAVPPMLLSAECRRCVYINTNGLIEDYSSEYKDRRIVNMWTDSEKEIFREKFLLYPKNFGAVAAFLEKKSVSDCVQYYYLSKKTENYKRLLKKSGHKNKSGRSRNKSMAAPLDAALLSTPPAPTIAPRFQRDYKRDGATGVTTSAAGAAGGSTGAVTDAAPPPASPVEEALSPTPVAQLPPAPPPQEPTTQPVVSNDCPTAPQAPASPEPPPPPDSTAPQSAPVVAAQQQTTPVVAVQQRNAPVAPQHQTAPIVQHQTVPILVTPPKLMKPHLLPFPDIPIVVIDDSDDSNSSSHFPHIKK